MVKIIMITDVGVAKKDTIYEASEETAKAYINEGFAVYLNKESISIPKQLQNENFRFILLRAREKIPFEKSWQDQNNYSHNDPKLINHIAAGGNYGVLTGAGGLVVLDFDKEELQDEIVPKLPATFTVRTGSGLLHKYYLTDNPESFKLLDSEKNTLADIQGRNKQVVGPGSIHPNGNKYEPIDDLPIANLSHAELKAALADYLPKEQEAKKPTANGKVADDIAAIKAGYSMPDYLRDCGIDTSKNPTMCPLHNSKGGKCLSFTDTLCNCFHCGVKGDIFSLAMAKEAIDFPKAKAMLAEKAGVELNNSITKTKTHSFEMQFWVGNGLYLINDKNGLFLGKRMIDTQSHETYYQKTKPLSYWHIISASRQENQYLNDEIVYHVDISNSTIEPEKTIKTLKGSIEEIVDAFKKLPGCLNSMGIRDILSSILGELEKLGLVSVKKNHLHNSWGFAIDKDKKIVAHDVFTHTKLTSEVSTDKLKIGLNQLFKIIDTYKKTDAHRDDLIRIVALGFIYPFNYARRQLGLIAAMSIIKGVTGTGKSLSGYIIQCCWGVWSKSGFEHTGSSVGSAFQLCRKLSENTFFVMINEAAIILNKVSEGEDISELLKNIIENAGIIYQKKSGTFIGYRLPMFTTNHNFKFASDALRVKVMVFSFGEDCTHPGKARAEIMQMLGESEKELAAIGSWITDKVVSGDNRYIAAITDKDYSRGSIELMRLLVTDAGLDYTLPEYARIGSFEDQDSTSFFDDFIDYMKREIFKAARQVIGSDRAKDGISIEMALNSLKENNYLPSWLIQLKTKNAYFIPAEIQQHVQKEKGEVVEIGIFEKECIERGFSYQKGYQIKKAGKRFCKNGLLISHDQFIKLFDNSTGETNATL